MTSVFCFSMFRPLCFYLWFFLNRSDYLSSSAPKAICFLCSCWHQDNRLLRFSFLVFSAVLCGASALLELATCEPPRGVAGYVQADDPGSSPGHPRHASVRSWAQNKTNMALLRTCTSNLEESVCAVPKPNIATQAVLESAYRYLQMHTIWQLEYFNLTITNWHTFFYNRFGFFQFERCPLQSLTPFRACGLCIRLRWGSVVGVESVSL